jgi:gliding-associated putative ABC transporter substrate-binding component GldG
MGKKEFSSKSLFNWGFLIIATAAIILVNIIASLVYVQYDMTDDQRYTLSNGTKTFLSDKEKFKNRISIKIYLEGNLPAEIKLFRNAIEDKLRAFKKISNDRIEYLFINPNNGSETDQNALFQTLYKQGNGIQPLDLSYLKDAEQTQIMLWPGAEISYSVNGIIKESNIQFLPGTKPGNPMSLNDVTELLENAINNLEYNLLSAIRNITQIEKPRIAFLQGHGELNYNQTIRARALIAPYYSLTEIKLNDSLASLNDVDGLIIADPQLPFTNKDLYIIDQFVMRGGKLMCFMNTLHLEEDTLMTRGLTHTIRKNLKLENMLFDYGLKINENYVIDVSCAPKIVPYAEQSMIPWFFHVLATPSPHPITRNIDPISLNYVNEIQFVPSKTTKITSLLTSSPNSNKTGLAPLVSLEMPLSYGKNPKLIENPMQDINKLCLAGMAEGKFSSHFQNRISQEFTNNKNSKYLKNSTKEGKILLVGNGSFIANSYDSLMNEKTGQFMYRAIAFNELKFNQLLANKKIAMYYGNQDFFENLVDYMMGENSILDIRSRQIDIKNIDKEKLKTMSGTLKIINFTLPILLILIFALIWNFNRVKKYRSQQNQPK